MAREEQFIAPRELILGGIGLGVALVLLVLLSLLQTSRKRREGAARLQSLEDEQGGLGDAHAGSTPFFVATYNGGNARFFRVYIAAGELLFVNAGQYFALIDAESVRGTDQRHWLLRSVKLIWIGLAGGAVAAAIGVGAILRGVARNAADHPEGAGDIMLMVLGIIGFLAVMVVVGVPLMLWQVTRRCRQLDPMPLARLRQEAELDPRSFRATPETVSEFNVRLLDQSKNFIASSEIGSTLTFKDAVAGKWKIETATTGDTRAALQALRSIWGREAVSVDPKLRASLGDREEAGDAAPPAVPLRERVAEKFNTKIRELDLTSTHLPRNGFPLPMFLGFTAGAVVAVLIVINVTATTGRFSYTGFLKTVFALGGLGTYLGHVVGCLRYREHRINPFGSITPRIMGIGGTIWMLGSIVLLAAAMGIVPLLQGPQPQ